MTEDREFSHKEICQVLMSSKNATAIYTSERLIIQMANDAMIGFWGKDRSVIGKTFEEAVPELKGQPFFELLREVWRTGITYTAVDTAAQLKADGLLQWFYYDFEYRAIKDEQGNTYCILHTAADVTGRHFDRLAIEEGKHREKNLLEALSATNEELTAANEELVRSQTELEQRVVAGTVEARAAKAEADIQRERMNRFFMQAPAGICILDGPGLVFEMLNPAYQQLFSGRELIGKTLLDALPELNGGPIPEILKEVYRTGRSYEGKEVLIPSARIEGGPIEERYFDFIYQARYDAGQVADGILVFVMEVTHNVNHRREIEENAERLRTQLDALPQIAWTNQLSGEVDYYNQQWYHFTGLTAEESKGNGWKTVIHPDDTRCNEDNLARILKSNMGGEFEVRERRADGVYRWHLVRMVPIKTEPGAIQSWIGTATDIHDLKLLHEQKDDFISIASHELKTPVTSLKSSLQILDRMKDNPSPVMLPRLIEQANRSVGKISELIEDLLDASKLNESQLHIVKKTFIVSEMLGDCCSHVRAAGKHELIFQGDRDLAVFADEHRISQVVVNFVNNAVKYAPGSREIYLIAEKAGNKVKISVKDHGPGIQPDKIPHLFSKYYRAEFKGAQYSGLGLGLYISAEIIRRHDGEVGVDSTLGEGSAFWFTLPANG